MLCRCGQMADALAVTGSTPHMSNVYAAQTFVYVLYVSNLDCKRLVYHFDEFFNKLILCD